jgi:hypothetical protein
MLLTDKIWQTIDGGYKVPYDASVALRLLEDTKDTTTRNNIWKELWNGLHHQGDVGLASYLAVPQLVRIGKAKGLFDWNLLGICCVIEQQRHLGDNPELPQEYLEYYNQGLIELKEFVLSNMHHKLDKSTYLLALSTLATCDGHIKLGKAIIELESDDVLDEFLSQF